MGKPEKKPEQVEKAKIKIDRIFGSVPWLRAKEVQRFKAKIFKSGNSLALRLPAGLGLIAGTEMELRVENGEYFSFEPVQRPKRKFNLAKVWGSASGLELIKPEDRVFAERRLIWDDPGETDLPKEVE
ncbi:MAG: antitoxin VapB [Sphingomonadales bacterium]|jgi:antitoxin VapB|nr:antitoxin VapB [Sphingomonadales bacterium]